MIFHNHRQFKKTENPSQFPLIYFLNKQVQNLSKISTKNCDMEA